MVDETKFLPEGDSDDLPETGAMPYIPSELQFDIREANVSITREAGMSLLIGRYNSQRMVDIDLSEYDGVRYGVSRQHIEIIPKQDVDRLVVKDLYTENGTALNGTPLKPGHLYLLQDGDELKLGAMHITVHFINE
jgi:pSer/pThr/pTyr-binding forkhead associated (FHA) protein